MRRHTPAVLHRRYAEAPIRIRWTASNDDIMTIASTYYLAKVPLESDFAIVLATHNPGTAALGVAVEFTEPGEFAAPGADLRSTLNIQVGCIFEPHPPDCHHMCPLCTVLSCHPILLDY